MLDSVVRWARALAATGVERPARHALQRHPVDAWPAQLRHSRHRRPSPIGSFVRLPENLLTRGGVAICSFRAIGTACALDCRSDLPIVKQDAGVRSSLCAPRHLIVNAMAFLTPRYDPSVVAASFLIASLASYVALDLAKRVRTPDRAVALSWWLGVP